MHKLALLLISSVLVVTGCKGGSSGPAPEVKTEEQKTIYSLGYQMGRSVSVFKLSKEEQEVIKKGLTDSLTGVKPDFETDAYRSKLQELARTRQMTPPSAAEAAKTAADKEKAKAYLENAAKEPGAVALPNGTIYKSVTEGTGASPVASDKVKVHYTGTLTDGKKFDSSVDRGQPAEFPLGGVIPCWTAGLQKMKVGGKAKLVCPSAIAYGENGRPPTIPGGATLLFDVELLEIVK